MVGNTICPYCKSAFGLAYDPSYIMPEHSDRIIHYWCQDCGHKLEYDTITKRKKPINIMHYKEQKNMNYIELSNIAFNQLSREESNICNAYLKFINKKIEEQFEKDGFREQLAEAIAKGLTYYIDENLNIKTLTEEEFYKTSSSDGMSEG